MERQKTTPDFLWSRQASSHRLPLGFSFMYVNLGPQVLNTAGAEVASVFTVATATKTCLDILLSRVATTPKPLPRGTLLRAIPHRMEGTPHRATLPRAIPLPSSRCSTSKRPLPRRRRATAASTPALLPCAAAGSAERPANAASSASTAASKQPDTPHDDRCPMN